MNNDDRDTVSDFLGNDAPPRKFKELVAVTLVVLALLVVVLIKLANLL